MTAPAPAGLQLKTLTIDEARAALREVVAAFEKADNKAKMLAARQQAGDDVMKLMQTVVPIAVEIQKGVITKYGFDAGQPGAMQFMNAIRAHEADAEIKVMADKLRAEFMPPKKN